MATVSSIELYDYKPEETAIAKEWLGNCDVTKQQESYGNGVHHAVRTEAI
jgi:hypothetical protein